MVLAGLGTIGVAAWAILLDARTHEAEYSQTALDRRIRLGNSLALGREVLYQKYLHADRGPTSLEEYELPQDWGRVTIDEWDSPVLGYSASTRVNKIGAVPFRGFSQDVEVGVDDGSKLHEFTYQLKSYSPLLGGDLLYVNKNAEVPDEYLEVNGDINVEGRALLWAGDYKSSTMTARTNAALTARDDLPKLTFLDTSESAILPSNFPFVAQTSGAVGGASDMTGLLNVVDNTDTPSNSYFAKIVDYGGHVEFDASTSGGAGEGDDTNPATSDEGTIASIIASANYTVDNLVPYSPISSDNLAAVLADPSLSNAEKFAIATANQPIPDDLYDDIINSTDLSEPQKLALLEGAGYYVYSNLGQVTVNLDSPSLPHMILRNVTSIKFVGQPDPASAALLEDEEPRIIALKNDPGVNLTSIEFQDLNSRRIIFAAENEGFASSGSATVTFTGTSPFPDWHMLLELRGIGTKWDTSAVGLVRFYGGIRTDQLINVTSGELFLRKETETDTLENMASRAAWIETVRN